MRFRYLRADEIDCRVATCNEDGVSLLLYKDARCDMNILDETVGPMNWQRSHSRENANCTVSLWDEDKKQWISKEDTGTESNTEAEKGLASDSFKRACFNWGIGRELYTAPFIWITSDKCKIKKDDRGKCKCYDKFIVAEMEVEGGRITSLKITNRGSVVFTMNSKPVDRDKEAMALASLAGVKIENILQGEGVSTLNDLSGRRYEALKRALQQKVQNNGRVG